MSTAVELQHGPKWLPDEILLQILSEFQFSYAYYKQESRLNKKTLYNACLVSKQLCGVAQTVLYRSLEGQPCHVLQLLSKSPRLSNMVQRLFFPSFNRLEPLWKLKPNLLQDRHILRSRLPNLPALLVDRIRCSLVDTDYDNKLDAILTLWLALLLKLRYLATSMVTRMPLMTALVRHYLESEPARFSSLSNMQLDSGSQSWKLGSNAILFELPSLKALHLCSCSWVEEADDSEFLLPPNAFPRLERLAGFPDFQISPRSLKNLLFTCKRLRSLVIEISEEVRCDPYEYELGDWLRSYCQNLECLDFKMDMADPLEEDEDTGNFEGQEWVNHVLGSLQSLTKLKDLELGLNFRKPVLVAGDGDPDGPQLDLVDMLPSSIETLCILPLGRTYPNHITDSLCRLVESEKHPNLRRVYATANSTLPRDVSHLGWSVRLDKPNAHNPSRWRYVKMIHETRRRRLSSFPEA